MSHILENLLSFIKNYKFIIILVVLFFIVYIYRKKLEPMSTNKTVTNQNIDFIQSNTFVGGKSGYIFKKDEKGLGYYLDN